MLENLALGLGAWTLLSVVVGLGAGRWLRRCSELAAEPRGEIRPFRNRVA